MNKARIQAPFRMFYAYRNTESRRSQTGRQAGRQTHIHTSIQAHNVLSVVIVDRSVGRSVRRSVGLALLPMSVSRCCVSDWRSYEYAVFFLPLSLSPLLTHSLARSLAQSHVHTDLSHCKCVCACICTTISRHACVCMRV